MNLQKWPVKAAAVALLVAAVTTFNSGPAGAVLVVVPGVAGVGAGGEFGGPDMAIEPAMASMKCNGAYLLVFACTASVVGKIEACVPVEGSVFGIGFSAQACAGLGAAGCASGTAALGSALRQCVATAYKEQVEYVEHCQQVGNWHSTYAWECHSEPVTTQESDSGGCWESHNYVLEDIEETLEHMSPVVPGWHAEACPGSAAVLAPWACIDLHASSVAKADLWDVADEANAPGCRNLKGAAAKAGGAVPSAGVSGVSWNDPADLACSLSDMVCVLVETDVKEEACSVVLAIGAEDCPPRSVSGIDPVGIVCSIRENMSKDGCVPDEQDVQNLLVMVCSTVTEQDPGDDPTVVAECRPDTASLIAMGKAAVVAACEGARDGLEGLLAGPKDKTPDGIVIDAKLPTVPWTVSVTCEPSLPEPRQALMSQLSASEQESLRTALYDRLKAAINAQDPTLTLELGLPGDRSLADQVWTMAYDATLTGAVEALAQDFYVRVVPGDA